MRPLYIRYGSVLCPYLPAKETSVLNSILKVFYDEDDVRMTRMMFDEKSGVCL